MARNIVIDAHSVDGHLVLCTRTKPGDSLTIGTAANGLRAKFDQGNPSPFTSGNTDIPFGQTETIENRKGHYPYDVYPATGSAGYIIAQGQIDIDP